MTRPLRPNVISTFDNPIVQLKCEPEVDKIDLDVILREVLIRNEFVLGTSFDLQFLTMDGTRILALRRYIVVSVVENIQVASMGFDKTMSKTVVDRKCLPLGDLFVFDPIAEVLRNGSAKPIDEKISIDKMGPGELEEIKRDKTGRGFKPGTSYEDMVGAVKSLIEA